MSHSQYTPFLENLEQLINIDSKVELFEWSLLRIFSRHLSGRFVKPLPIAARCHDLGQRTRELGCVLSMMAYAGASDQSSAQRAYDASAAALASTGLALLANDQIRIADLDQALGKLVRLAPAAKSRLLPACVVSMWHDQSATPAEVELLRAFASVLDCPMPPGMASGVRRKFDQDQREH